MTNYHDGKITSEFFDMNARKHTVTTFKDGTLHYMVTDKYKNTLSSTLVFPNGDKYTNVESIDEDGNIIMFE